MQLVCVLKSYLDVLSGADLSVFSKGWEMLILTGLLSLFSVPGRLSGAGESGRGNAGSRLAPLTGQTCSS